jgi:predicted ATPase
MKTISSLGLPGSSPRNPRIIVVAATGGPGGGKSGLLKEVCKLRIHGNIIVTAAEAARAIMEAGLHPVKNNWKYDRAFQEAVFELTLRQENLLITAASQLGGNDPIILLCDRGLCDGQAYTGPEAFGEILQKYNMTREQIFARYDLVLHMVTAAIGAEEHYKNDPDRIEPLHEAITLEVNTMESWKGHPNVLTIDNSTDFEGKLARALLGIRKEVASRQSPFPSSRSFSLIGVPHEDTAVAGI